jgi:hypothetical protein
MTDHPEAQLEAQVRHERDRAELALEEVARLRDELDAAQRVCAQALHEADVAKHRADTAEAEAERVKTELEALEQAPRTWITRSAGALRRRVAGPRRG